LKYLRDQNRPYSTNDIVLNLHKEHGKTAVQKALDSLVAETKVTEKLNGKQKAYVVNQSDLPTASEEELASLDAQFKEVEVKLKGRTEEWRSVESKVKALTAQPTNGEAAEVAAALMAEVERLEAKLKSLTEGQKGQSVVSKKDKAEVERKHEASVKEWRKRKRMCGNVMDAILENYPKPKKAFIEDVGIETDEEVGAKMPDI